MSDDNTKPILLVKKSDSKKGSFWHKLANRRIIKQHGGYDIPEGDLHAITKYHNPVETPKASSEETKEALSELEKEIRQLREHDMHPQLSQNTSSKNDDHFDYED